MAERAEGDRVLAQASVFQGLPDGAIIELLGQLEPVNFERGRVIFHENDAGDQSFIIAAGKVKIGRSAGPHRDTLIALMGPSDMFGELALFDPGPRTSTATALTDVRAVSMTREILHTWLRSHPEIAEQLLRVLARRLRRTNDIMSDLIFTDVPGRVAKQLLHLARRFGVSEGNSIRLDHELTQVEIAQLVGSTRETVNKALVEFARRGWIRAAERRIWIDQPALLAQRAR